MADIAGKISKFLEKEVSLLFKKARRTLHVPGLTILCHPEAKEWGRILVITSRKVGSAPERNLIRRRLKAIYYQEKLFEYHIDCIVIVKPSAKTLSFDELKTLLIKTVSSYKPTEVGKVS